MKKDKKEQKICKVALSGGVARAVSHIGVIKALLEEGFEIKAISGTSAGALVGLFLAHGYSPEDMLYIIKNTNWFKVFGLKLYSGLLSFKRAKEILKDYIKVSDIKELNFYFSACAVDLIKGDVLFLDEGDPILATLASCAVPGIFEPIKYKDKLLVDGGVVNNLPTEPLKEKEGTLIGVDVIPIGIWDKKPNIINVILRSSFISMRRSIEEKKNACDIFLTVPVGHISATNIFKAKELFDIGYYFTKEKLYK